MKCLNCKILGWGEEYPGKKFFGWCKEVHDMLELDRERECEYFVQATNGDIIRRMSDEELAYQFGAQCPKGRKRECDKLCHKCWLEWLRQPAEEDT